MKQCVLMISRRLLGWGSNINLIYYYSYLNFFLDCVLATTNRDLRFACVSSSSDCITHGNYVAEIRSKDPQLPFPLHLSQKLPKTKHFNHVNSICANMSLEFRLFKFYDKSINIATTKNWHWHVGVANPEDFPLPKSINAPKDVFTKL